MTTGRKLLFSLLFICLSISLTTIKSEASITDEWNTLLGDEIHSTFGFQAAYLKGYTDYHIRFDNPDEYGGHGESKLEFPLDNFLLGIEGCFSAPNPKDKKHDKHRFTIIQNMSIAVLVLDRSR